MRLFNPYQQLNRIIEQETLESTFSWALRMAIAAIVPVIWGVSTGNLAEAGWISLTAECISWVELRGTFGQGVRVLTGGTILAVVFAVIGSVTGGNIWFSMTAMALVGFLSGLFKNLGDRGSGLAISIFVIFLLTNWEPVGSFAELTARVNLIFIGGVWNALVGIFILAFMPAREPYRRTIGLIWKAVADLVGGVAKGWDGIGARSNIRELYQKEKDVRNAIDQSLHFYGAAADQVSKDHPDYQLAQIRKATALVATHIIAISEELENLGIREVSSEVKLKLHSVFKGLQQTVNRMAVYVITLKPEDELLLSSRLSRLIKLLSLLKEEQLDDSSQGKVIMRAIQLTERTVRLIENSVGRLEEMGDDKAVFRSYSLIKTLLVLHPRHWVRNLQLLFNLNTFTARYALRSAAGATVGIFLWKWFDVDHGFWIPLTTMIVMQPYFGATIKKAVDRIIGTVLGGLVGGLLINIPTGIFLKEFLLFVSLILMVYFIRTRYSVSVFFITLSLVVLFNMEGNVEESLLITRALSTIGGASLAIITGFALLPHWDKKWLPLHLTNAISGNYQYFLDTFFSTGSNPNWTKNKRNSESKNSNAFDSFSRYMQEPALNKKPYAVYYHIITHNVRITRELNNINLEQEGRKDMLPAAPVHEEAINNCLLWFNKNILLVQKIDPDNKTKIKLPNVSFRYPFSLTIHQTVYMEKMLIELKAMNQSLQQLAEKHEAE
jgi:hypothetical protein